MALNNVELWEPIRKNSSSTVAAIELAPAPVPPGQPSTAPVSVRPNFHISPQFFHRKSRNGLQTWLRIAYLQLTAGTYRILVRPDEPLALSATVHYLVRTGQLSLFVWGSMTQGGTNFMPSPTDYGLTALLVFATASPRLVWPHFWRCWRRGADLVVWVRPPY